MAQKKQQIFDNYAQMLRVYDDSKRKYYLKITAYTDSGTSELLPLDRNSNGADKFLSIMNIAKNMQNVISVTVSRFESIKGNSDPVETQSFDFKEQKNTGEKALDSQYQFFGGLNGFIQAQTNLGQLQIEKATMSNSLSIKEQELIKLKAELEKLEALNIQYKQKIEDLKDDAKERIEQLKDTIREQKNTFDDQLREKDRAYRDEIFSMERKASLWGNLSGSLEKVATTVVSGLAGIPMGAQSDSMLGAQTASPFIPQVEEQMEVEPEVLDTITRFKNWMSEINDVELAQECDLIIHFLMTDSNNATLLVNEINGYNNTQNNVEI